MRTRLTWLALLAVLTMVMTACAGGNNGSSTTETVNPNLQTETGSESMTTVDPLFEEQGTPGADVAPDQPGALVSQAPVLASSLLVYEVAGQEGNVGRVDGLVMDGLTGKMLYLLVETTGPTPVKHVLLPQRAFQVVTLPPADALQGAEPAPQVWLNVDNSQVFEAPALDESQFAGGGAPGVGWDEATRDYWTGVQAEIPNTGGQETDPESVIMVQSGALQGIDFEVENSAGENLGEIEDFVIGQDGTVLFVVLEPVSLLDLGDQLIPVSWQLVSYFPEERKFIIKASPEALSQAPRLDPGNLPDMTVPGWEGEWQQYWNGAREGTGTPLPAQTEGASSQSIRVGTISTLPVQDLNGSELGQVVDWMVDMNGGSEFSLLATSSGVSPVPWGVLVLRSREGFIVFNENAAVLSGAPIYDSVEMLEDDESWHESAAAYWADFVQVGQPDPQATEAAGWTYLRATRLMGISVIDPEGNAIGNVQDLIVNTLGQMDYVVVHANEQFHPVPWINFELDAEKYSLTYLDDTARLAAAPGYFGQNELDTNVSDWDGEIRKYWGMQ